jgi:hypothetical protein
VRRDGRLGTNERRWIKREEKGEGAKKKELTTWD